MQLVPQEGRLPMTGLPLAGHRVLVVEDEPLVAMFIEELLVEQQSVVVGPFNRLEAALEAARSAAIDIALLDVIVEDVAASPVAHVLSARRIPFLLLSDYDPEAVPADHPEWGFCSKPFSGKTLVRKMLEQLSSR